MCNHKIKVLEIMAMWQNGIVLENKTKYVRRNENEEMSDNKSSK